jgi:hypothetical protein
VIAAINQLVRVQPLARGGRRRAARPGSSYWCRAIPEQHWKPLRMIRSFRRGTPASFRPRRGLRSLDPAVR